MKRLIKWLLKHERSEYISISSLTYWSRVDWYKDLASHGYRRDR